MVIGAVALVAAIFAAGALVAHRTRREAHAEEVLILQGVRRVCKLATVELSLADYAKKTRAEVGRSAVHEASRRRFCSTLAPCRPASTSATAPAGIAVDHAVREVRITLPPPRILSVDISRFETINERSGFLNAIAPEDRNRWYAEARAALENGALAQGALDSAQTHARELFEAFVERHGYTLVMTIQGGATGRTAAHR